MRSFLRVRVLPDGSLGIVQYINGRIIRIALDGTPLGSMRPPGDEHGGAAMSSIRRVRARGGTLVVNGTRVAPAEDGEGMVRTQYLVRCDLEARPLLEYLSRTVPSNLVRDGWRERANYFPSHERWADFLHRLEYVVVDEMHTLRGIFGTHVAMILRRLRRIADLYGSNPTFVFGSATIGMLR